MRFQVWAWRCEVVTCGHTWLATDITPPPQCAKCKSRKWHTKPTAIEGAAIEAKLDLDCADPEDRPIAQLDYERKMQALRDICAGKSPGYYPKEGVAIFEWDNPAASPEIPICGKAWWEDGNHYECLMDKGHKELKHGLRGMVRVID